MRTHQLETTLRSLSLSGMLDTLEARLAQADAGELGHVEFLQSLCEDELSRRDAAGIARRVRAARFEQVCVPSRTTTSATTQRSRLHVSAIWPHCASSKPANR